VIEAPAASGGFFVYLREVKHANCGYEPFGSLLPGRNYSSDSYRFGFQGQEKDDEINGATGTSYAFEYRMHDPRIGRFLSIDPLAAKYPHNSPYAFSENRVIDGVDLEGLEHAHYMNVYLSESEGRTVLYNFSADKVNEQANTLYVMTTHNVEAGASTSVSLTRAAFYNLADELGVVDQLPDRSIGDWWSDETMGTKEFRDFPSPVHVEEDGVRTSSGDDSPEGISWQDGAQDPQVGRQTPSTGDIVFGTEYPLDDFKHGDTVVRGRTTPGIDPEVRTYLETIDTTESLVPRSFKGQACLIN